jgi:hypothetical protein
MRQDRETTQLLSAARYYYHLAKSGPRKSLDMSITSDELARQQIIYNRKGSLDGETKIFAHLSSAAIRLAAIHEKYDKFGTGKQLALGSHYRKEYQTPTSPKRTEAENRIKTNLAEYIHYLLRDDISHFEDAKFYIREFRRSVIGSVPLDDALKGLGILLKKCEGSLLRAGIVR